MPRFPPNISGRAKAEYRIQSGQVPLWRPGVIHNTMTSRSILSACVILTFAATAAARPEEAAPIAVPPAAPAAAPAAAPKCPYPVAHDAPLDAQTKVVEKTNTYTKHRVEFNGVRKDRVPGFLYVPNDGKAKHPAVLLQYGTGGNKSTFYIVALGEQFVAKGFVVLTIDSPMKGERRPPRDQRNWWSGLGEQGRFTWYCGDYSRSVDYLVTRPEVDPDRVGYAGVSWGAITGITFAAHDPRIKAVASIVGGGNFMGFLSDKVEMSKEALEAAKTFDPVYHVSLIAPRPLLLLNVTRDQLVPRFFSESLHKAAGRGATRKWIETDHFFQGVDRYAILEDVIAFMLDGLPEK
jgi:uncharacterized protein